MGRRRRFGISIPESMARSLDELARMLNTDRSRLVEEALRTYLHDHVHLLEPHECRGVMLVTSSLSTDKVLKIVESFNDVVKAYLHVHDDRGCAEVIVVTGSSARIAGLHRELMRLPGCKVRYVPLVL